MVERINVLNCFTELYKNISSVCVGNQVDAPHDVYKLVQPIAPEAEFPLDTPPLAA